MNNEIQFCDTFITILPYEDPLRAISGLKDQFFGESNLFYLKVTFYMVNHDKKLCL